MKPPVARHVQELVTKYPALAKVQKEIVKSFDIIENSLRHGGTLFTCGNGGSAADAEHIAGELLKGFHEKRPLTVEHKEALQRAAPTDDAQYLTTHLQEGLSVVSLTGHPALATAVANDLGSDVIFAQQLLAMGRAHDVLLAISTSGMARNVLLATYVADALQMGVVGLTGHVGGTLGRIADVAICAPAERTHEVQELHLPVYHTLCAMLETAFFGS